ncbi:PTS system mannose/fructose/sorbose family transporter subunit IID [Tetragenococcus halophilus]|uniref:PTS system mannose/fructose/sorbose family transporter subunit IID n=1 Tax=Tetragenococcus halophilus TaxID=51669 RepID=UPI0015BDF068|nr:PTS system mannose/fructose/sorbose family transporter subunit IID [Tetragenococcus halophilus]NWN99981.1 PTS system mannose/fructose/sorbose family transporter subunit IID [Tetragenococcus halophilus]
MTTISNSLTKKDLRKSFWRTFAMGSSWEFSRQLGVGYAYAMTPLLEKIYKNQPDELKESMERNTEFFNVSNFCSSTIMGITASMEEQNAVEDDFDTKAISNIKVSLMGPLSAIGDSLVMGTWRIICTSIAATFALKGNIIGPLLFIIAYNLPCTLIRWFGLKYGYSMGISFFEKINTSNVIDKISYYSSILGMLVIGAMTSDYVVMDTPLTFGQGDAKMSLQTDVFDQIVPGLLPLLVTFIMYKLLKKGIGVWWIILGTFVLGILCSYFNILVP